MKNKFLKITEGWTVNRDEFHAIDPLDESIEPEAKYANLYCQEDLLSISKMDYHLDLGWYGEESENGYFCLYLYRGDDWHNCELLEKVQSKNLKEITEEVNACVEKVDNGDYSKVQNRKCSIDEYLNLALFSVTKRKITSENKVQP